MQLCVDVVCLLSELRRQWRCSGILASQAAATQLRIHVVCMVMLCFAWDSGPSGKNPISLVSNPTSVKLFSMVDEVQTLLRDERCS